MATEDLPTDGELDAAEETVKRQREWRQRSAEKQAAERAERAADLAVAEEAVRRAVEAYMLLPESPVAVRLRAGFVALSVGRPLPPSLGGEEPDDEPSRSEQRLRDRQTRPPMTRLVSKQSRALPAYLAMLYTAHAGGAGWIERAIAWRKGGQESWAVLCGAWDGEPRTRRARMTRLLDELHRADLVRVGGKGVQARYEGFRVLQDDGADRDYRTTRPTAGWPTVLEVPGSFFRSGWHLALTPAEIATYLIVRHATLAYPPDRPTPDWYIPQPGIGLARKTRWSIYGLTSEAYESIHELEEFGLIEIVDTMPHRRRGKLRDLDDEQRAKARSEGDSLAPVPYRLVLCGDEVLDRPAQSTVLASLKTNSLPPRLTDPTA